MLVRDFIKILQDVDEKSEIYVYRNNDSHKLNKEDVRHILTFNKDSIWMTFNGESLFTQEYIQDVLDYKAEQIKKALSLK